MSPAVSIIIPAFNRIEPLKFTLRSAADAAHAIGEPVEILLVDDGSIPPLADQLAGFEPHALIRYLRQPNAGSIAARLNGLAAAEGEFILFLDSDDLIHPCKLRLHVSTLRTRRADISYDNQAVATLGPDYSATFKQGSTAAHASDPADFFLRVQPLPHGPVYRRDWLHRHLLAPIVPARRQLDCVGDVWLYYNLAASTAKIIKVDHSLTAIGPHDEDRFSRRWEKLAVAALLLAEAFLARCPPTTATLAARQTAGEVAFESWRRLPFDFHPGFDARLLGIWQRAPRRIGARLGGPGFSTLARLLGPVAAGRLLRRACGGRYATCRTLSDEELAHLLAP